jgi:hypothetical protein
MHTEIQTAVNRFVSILDTLPAQLSAIPVAELSIKPGPDKWSKKQIIGHLIDSAANNHQRFIRAQYEKVPRIVYDQNKWNTINFYDEADATVLIDLLCNYNRHLLFVFQHIPSESLSQKYDSGNTEPATLAFLINDYVAHFEHHLTQLLS